MKRITFATLVLLVLSGSSVVRAQGLSAERIKNPGVRYVPESKLKEYPLPAVAFERGGLANDEERAEILDKIVYPFINESPEAVAAVVIDLIPINPHPKTKAEIGFRKITVTVLWHNGNNAGALIEKNKDGHFDEKAYAIFLGSDEDACCSDDECEIEPSTPTKKPDLL